MAKILIIGGTGNISTGITNILLEKGGHEIFHVNRGLRDKNIEGVKTIIADRNDPENFKNAVESAGIVDCVIDMICYHPEEAHQAVRLFKGKTGQYIFCSTVDVYDRRHPVFPMREDHQIGGKHPKDEYALHKMLCEQILDEANSPDFPVTVLRPAMTYSEGMPLVHLFGWDTYFIDRIRKGKKIIAHGDGSSIWVTAHRDDVAVAFVNAIGNSLALGKKYNVTGMELLTWTQYYALLAWSNGYQEPEFVFIPTRNLIKMDPEHSFILKENYAHNNIFDNNAAINDLGYQYTIDWMEGSARMVSWLEQNKKIEDYLNYPFYDSLINKWLNITGLPE